MKYIVKPGVRGLFQISNNGEMDVTDYMNSYVDWYYRVPQDGELTVKLPKGRTFDLKEQQLEVKKDDIVAVFYPRDGAKYSAVVIRQPQWIENIEGINAENTKDKHDKEESRG